MPCVDSRRAFALNKRVRKLGGFAHNKLSPGHERLGLFIDKAAGVRGRDWLIDKKIGSVIRMRRLKLGLSQTDLGNDLGVSLSKSRNTSVVQTPLRRPGLPICAGR